MWQRIAMRFSFWFEPAILACYRMHSGSATTKLRQTAMDAREVGITIKLMSARLPASRAARLAPQARSYYASFAIENARDLLVAGHRAAAWWQIRESLRLSCTGPVLVGIGSFVWLWLRIAGSKLKQAVLGIIPKSGGKQK
jgi:hypothetical protein